MDTTATVVQDVSQIDWSKATDEEILAADLIIALGLDTLSDEDKAALADRMITTVQKAIAVRVIDSLPEHLQITLNKLADDDEPEKLNEFMMTHVPNFADLVQEELIKFKRAMLAPADTATPVATATQ